MGRRGANTERRVLAATAQANRPVLPPGMNMGSDHTGGWMGPNPFINAVTGPSMPMFPLQEMVVRRFEQLTKTEGTAATKHHRSNRELPCANGGCGKVLASASPAEGTCAQLNSLQWITTKFRTSVILSVDFPFLGPGISPPGLLTANRPLIAIRI